jgi:hypothetical protein
MAIERAAGIAPETLRRNRRGCGLVRVKELQFARRGLAQRMQLLLQDQDLVGGETALPFVGRPENFFDPARRPGDGRETDGRAEANDAVD